MTAMKCFCRRTSLLLKEKRAKTNNNKKEEILEAEKQMRRNDCNELFLHACWLVLEGKKRKNKKQTGRTRGGNDK